jgi:hypothetical protein
MADPVRLDGGDVFLLPAPDPRMKAAYTDLLALAPLDYPERLVELIRSGQLVHSIPLVHALASRLDQYERYMIAERMYGPGVPS